MEFDQELEERFLGYVQIDTQSDESSPTSPSTAKQFDLLRPLHEELQALGAQDVRLTDYGAVIATIPATISAITGSPWTTGLTPAGPPAQTQDGPDPLPDRAPVGRHGASPSPGTRPGGRLDQPALAALSSASRTSASLRAAVSP